MGGKRRAANMKPEERSKSASQAAAARWSQLSPEERSIEMKRRARKRRKKKSGPASI
jgi:hypothetical protein